MSAAFPWSDDRVATLKRLWRDGLSASRIARELGGLTRNAVLGKLHRLGLVGRETPSRPGRVPRAPAPRRARPRPVRSIPARTPPGRPPATPAAASAPETGLIHDLTHLGRHACKWPIGDPKAANFSFCGRPANGRYCAAHERLGVQPATACRLTAVRLPHRMKEAEVEMRDEASGR